MPEEYRNEKEEKQEKDEKHRRDPLGGAIFGLIVIAVGVLFLLASQDKIDWGDWWAYLLTAIGCIFIIEVILRSIMPAFRRPVFGKLLAGLILIAIGASNIYGWGSWWPLIVIGAGILILFNALFRQKKP